jgi:hypothetical protein
MNTQTEQPLTPELAAMLQDIGPLPLSGQAWPDWVRILAWVLLALVGSEILTTLIRMPPEEVHPIVVVLVVVVFLGLGVIAWFMQTSITTIDAQGLRQTWFTRRQVAWQDIRSVRFLPLVFSKRLLVITRAGRPVVFQGGTRELQRAFMRIVPAFGGKPAAGPPPTDGPGTGGGPADESSQRLDD